MSAVYNDVFCNTVMCVMATIDSFFKRLYTSAASLAELFCGLIYPVLYETGIAHRQLFCVVLLG